MLNQYKKRSSRKAFTIVELIVYIGIFSLLLAGVTAMFKYLGHFKTSTQRLDVLHSLRLSSFKLSEELALSQEFLSPTGDDPGKIAHQIVYFNNSFELIVVFIQKEKPQDEFGRLVKINWTEHLKKPATTPELEVLANGAIELNVSRPSYDYLEYEVKIKEFRQEGQPEGKTFTLANGAKLRSK
ncbi:MAG: type II secretion system GspH family protein [Candidatus Riflebacteria bacterium]|nr:type II secretion system GspH family protein [Candidatus Riflebacteria bacterium]